MKHIFVGETRVVSKLSHYWKNEIDIEYEKRNQYWYHPDHLGNTTYVTTVKEEYGLRYAQIFEHYEYMPYGETWIEERDKGARKIGY